MSAFGFCLDFSSAPLESTRFARLSRWLKRRALDGASVDRSLHFAAIRAHFEPNAQRPNTPHPDFFFEGWLSDPTAAERLLDVPAGTLNDSELAFAAVRAHGSAALAHLIGSFALAWIDRANHQVLLARDALGVRTLFYRFDGSLLEVASEPMALVAAQSQPPQLNERFIAHQLAMRAGVATETGFVGISELPPGHFVILARAPSPRIQRYWTPDTELMHSRSLDDYAEGYLTHLQAAVAGALRGVDRCALTLSGGIDSGSVLAMLRNLGADERLGATISYVFDELSSADERAYALAARAECAAPALLISADALWPLKSGSLFPLSANVPIFNPYGLIKRAVNEAALARGARVVLTGTFGDHLYPPTHSWLEDALTQGDFAYAGIELLREIQRERYRFWMSAALRRAARRLLLGDRIKPWSPPWLTPRALAHIDPQSLLLAGHRGHLRLATGLVAAQDCSGEAFFSEHDGLQWRNPFRDQRLVAYALRVPAHFAYRRGVKKAYARHALRGQMHEFTRLRIRKTSLIEIYRRGVLEQEREQVAAIFARDDALWRTFLRPEFLAAGAMGARATESDEAVLWLALCSELWWQRVLSDHRSAQEL